MTTSCMNGHHGCIEAMGIPFIHSNGSVVEQDISMTDNKQNSNNVISTFVCLQVPIQQDGGLPT